LYHILIGYWSIFTNKSGRNGVRTDIPSGSILETLSQSHAAGHLYVYQAVLTLQARKMHETQLDPDDQAAVQCLNLEVARLTGHRVH
jgi:hypothetical protein